MRASWAPTLVAVTGFALVSCDDDECPERGIWYGDAIVDSSSDLEAICGFEEIRGELLVNETVLKSLDHLDRLRVVEGEVVIANNLLLEEVCLPALESAFSVEIVSNDELDRVDLFSLERANELTLRQSPVSQLELGPVRGLSEVTIANTQLTSLPELPHVVELGSLKIERNPNLEDVDELSGLTRVAGARGLLMISHNGALLDLEGLSNVESVAGAVLVESNHSLTSIGLRSLSSIELNAYARSDLVIVDNDGLVDLDDLAALRIGGSLDIRDNAVLTSVDGLAYVTAVSNSSQFAIRYNQALPSCAAVALYDVWTAAGSTAQADIEGNDDTGTCD